MTSSLGPWKGIEPLAQFICRTKWFNQEEQQLWADMVAGVSRSNALKKKVRVLVVEDNPGDFRLVKCMLQEAKFNLFQIHNVEKLSLAEGMLSEIPYDAVLLDLNLPDSKGIDTFIELRKDHPEVPIVVLTGSTDEELAIRAVREGAQDYLFKDELTIRGLSHVVMFAIERKRIEDELIEEKTRAELYLDLLTHDIINYNTAAMGYLQLADMRLDPDHNDHKLITRPLEELRNSSELIANIQDIQALEEGRDKSERINICTLLKEVKEEYEAAMDREITITLAEEGHCSVTASNLLKAAFSNLVSNSIKHSSGSVHILMTLSFEKQDGNEVVRVSVEDDGPGIPDEMKEKVFSRSLQGLTKAVGHGLGLYLVRRLVDGYGGKVWVEDRVSGDHTKGARFVVMLPAS